MLRKIKTTTHFTEIVFSSEIILAFSITNCFVARFRVSVEIVSANGIRKRWALRYTTEYRANLCRVVFI